MACEYIAHKGLVETINNITRNENPLAFEFKLPFL